MNCVILDGPQLIVYQMCLLFNYCIFVFVSIHENLR